MVASMTVTMGTIPIMNTDMDGSSVSISGSQTQSQTADMVYISFFHFSREEHSPKLSSGPPGFGFRTCMAYSASGYKTRLNRSQDLGVLEMC